MGTIRIGMVDMVAREPMANDAPGTLYASNLTREGTVERSLLRSVCASITAAQSGKVRWTRVGESSGSGIERTEGAWDSRPITKAWLNDAGNGVLYLFVRGMCGPDTPVTDGNPAGVFSWRPSADRVGALSDLLDGRRAAA